MLDIRFVREHAKEVEKNAKNKGYTVDIAAVLKLDDMRRDLRAKIDSFRQERNELVYGFTGGKPTQDQLEEGRQLRGKLSQLEEQWQKVEIEFRVEFIKLPNMALESVPVGKTEKENKVVKKVGEPRQFGFEPKNHWQLAEERGLIDKERAAKIAGARFAYIKGDLVRLQFAIMQWVMSELTSEATLNQIIADNGLKVSSKPFMPILPPAMVRTEVYEATARLNAEETTYKLADDDLWLNASAEHSICPIFMGEILPEADLPQRFIGYSTSFRREAGTYGKDMEGIIRMHQFDKLEMESFSTADTGQEEHRFFIAIQEYLMQRLAIPYEVMEKCTADIGGPNAAGTDINAWRPAQKAYTETHTADYMTDYQARRLQTRVRREDGKLELVHTNDATAFALGRTMVAIIENYQNEDGSITVPEVLRPYLGGKDRI